MDKHITTPITEEVTKDLKSGDYVYITGTIYVARDAAHKRMIEALQRGEELPIDIKDSTIYYMGPSPAREGRPIGSAGPTTAARMVQTNDKVIIMAYADVTPEEAKQQKPVVVFVDENNHTTEITNYERHGEISAIR